MKARRLFVLTVIVAMFLALWQVSLISAREPASFLLCITPTVTASPSPSELGSITVHKFHDRNRNGVQDAGEEDIEGWLIRLYIWAGDNIVLYAEGRTGPDGTITFGDLEPRRYKVWEEMPPCWEPATKDPPWAMMDGYGVVFDLYAGEHRTVEFGNVYVCAVPCIDLEKTGPETAYPGETITYHYWVHNCGDIVLLGGALVYDPLFGDDPLWHGDLQPDEVHEFDMTYTLPDDYCGNFVNHAWAIGHPPGYPDVRDDDEWTVFVICEVPAPSIDIEKYVSVDSQQTWEDADTPPGPEAVEGTPIYFRFVVTNDGNVALSDITLSDSDFDLSTCEVPPSLGPGESFTCVIGPFTDISGQHTDTGTATGAYESESYSDQDDANVTVTGLAPAIQVTKTADPTEVPEPGGEVGFTVVVTNTSAVDTVIISSLTDSIHGDLNGQGTCSVPQTLAPGYSYSCSFTARVEGNAGYQETDTVIASGTDDEGNPVSGSDDATVAITNVPSSIEVDKKANPTEVPEPGGMVTFTVVVTNTGAVDTVTITSLEDDIYGDLTTLTGSTCSVPQVLEPGQSYMCTFSVVVTGVPGEELVDTVSAEGVDDDGEAVEGDDSVAVTITDVPSSIEVEKTADPTELTAPGGEVGFTVVVTNTSAVDMVTIISLTDSIHGDLNGQGTCSVPQTLAPGGSYSCSFTAQVEGNAGYQETDTVIASGTDDDGGSVEDSDDATVTIRGKPPTRGPRNPVNGDVSNPVGANPLVSAPAPDGAAAPGSAGGISSAPGAAPPLPHLTDDEVGLSNAPAAEAQAGAVSGVPVAVALLRTPPTETLSPAGSGRTAPAPFSSVPVIAIESVLVGSLTGIAWLARRRWL